MSSSDRSRSIASGATPASGDPSPGRRVKLPFGNDGKLNWRYVNGNGRSVLQRAIKWAARASTCTEHTASRQIAVSADDAEEFEITGQLYLDSFDLEFGYDSGFSSNVL